MYIGIDLGTSFIKGAVLDLDRFEIRDIHRIAFPEPIKGLPPLYREFDPAAILSAVQALLKEYESVADSCQGIMMCGQMHGLILTTAQGKPRSTLINWQDERSLLPHPSGNGTHLDSIIQILDVEEIRQLGNELRPGLPICSLAWMVEQNQLNERGLFALSLPDFVFATLCETGPVTDVTNAAAHGLLNLETMNWHTGVIEKLHLDQFRLPEIRPHRHVSGTLYLGGHAIPCYTPMGDYQAALSGSLLREQELSLNIATGSQVSLLTPHPVFGQFQTRPYFDDQFTATFSNVPAGRSLNVLVRLVSELADTHRGNSPWIDPWEYIIQAVDKASKTQAESLSELEVDLSFYSNNLGSEGSITHILESNFTVGNLFRAAFQSMANNFYECAVQLSPSKAWNSIVLAGGLAQKIPSLRAAIADKFLAELRIPPYSEDTFLGLLAVALTIDGRTTSVRESSDVLIKALSTHQDQ